MRRSNFCKVLLLVLTLPAVLWGSEERVMVGEDIVVTEDEVLREVVCIGCSIHVEGTVTENAVAIGGNLEIDNLVEGEAVAIGGSVTVNGTVGGEIVAIAGDVNLSPGAAAGSDVVAIFGSVNGAAAAVDGEIMSMFGPQRKLLPLALSGLAAILLGLALFLLLIQPMMVFVAFVILGENRVQVLANTIRQRAGLAFLSGIGLVFCWMILTFLIAITGLWIPGLEVVFFVVLVVGYSGISYWVGRGMSKSSGPLAAVLLGALLVTIFQAIPLIGWLGFAIFSMMALGSAVLSGFGTSTDWLVRRGQGEPMSWPTAG